MLRSTSFLKPAQLGHTPVSYLRIPGYRYMLTLEQILWIQGDGNYCRIHLTSGQQIMISQTLRVLADLLPQLVRIHKSSLVNPGYVQQLKAVPGQKTGLVLLTNGLELAVSRRRYEEISDLFKRPEMA